jgi:predicted RNA-binding Zn-ribbon protein involved in translation (DUF1610 family)
LAQARDDWSQAMRIRWRASEYERTCDECSYAWRVPGFAGRRKTPIAGYSVAPGRTAYNVPASSPEVGGSLAISQADAAYARCPKCGADRFTQRAARCRH